MKLAQLFWSEKGEPLSFLAQLDVLGCATNILPTIASYRCLKGDAIKLSVTQKDDITVCGHHVTDLFYQLHVHIFRKMAFLALDDNPGNRQRPLLVDDADHQGYTSPPHVAAVNDQNQGLLPQTEQQGLGEGQKVEIRFDALVGYLTGELFDSTFMLGAVRHLAGHPA